ncbi:MAG: hypothetical protein IJ462_02705 [Clostridia bacterium]|nr:hypothetical protein [Clostridia bacterium]
MKKFRNALILVLCALLLVGGTFAVTLAYLTSQDTVTNTFTVGDIEITLDEADVDEYGVAVSPAARVDNNEYLLIPNKTYLKDPTIHVDADSEDSWIFVKIENNIDDVLVATGEDSIAAQLTANGWVAVTDETNVYAYSTKYEKGQAKKDFVVFDGITVDANADLSLVDEAADQIVVTGYAVQAEGFATAQAAWDATFGA